MTRIQMRRGTCWTSSPPKSSALRQGALWNLFCTSQSRTLLQADAHCVTAPARLHHPRSQASCIDCPSAHVLTAAEPNCPLGGASGGTAPGGDGRDPPNPGCSWRYRGMRSIARFVCKLSSTHNLASKHVITCTGALLKHIAVCACMRPDVCFRPQSVRTESSSNPRLDA